MGVELFKHNAVAYQKVTKMFETENRVAVVHPTGCGKSFISLKWLEENRDKRAVFLAPTVSILRQITKHIESCGMSIKDFPLLRRYTYSKLSRMTAEEISKLDVDMIVLDEFHRCGASEWSRGIASLINNNSSAKVLGFSATPIRYLDEHRNMVEELFHGNIASEITLEEAMVNDILPMPTYINVVYSFKDDIENMQERINKEKRDAEKLQAQQYLDDAKKLLEKADGLPEIFEKHMKNKSGKYIVFCRNKEHMQKMMEESKMWFQGVNEQVDKYAMASFIPKSENLKVFEKFYNSENDHLKLLFSIDMLNEEIHIPNIDGVIMLRPTESPIIFKQQLGRALSVGHNANPLVFDIVNNVQSCEMISHFYRELRERALVKFTQTGKKEDEVKIDAFKISDIVRQIQDIFSKIDNCLSLSWDDYYELAVEYYKEYGNLLVPANYSKNGMNLGCWITDQRKAMKGQGHRKDLTEEQIKKLESIGMVWDKFKEQWDETYAIAKAYYDENDSLNGLKDKKLNDKNIYQWLRDQIKSYNKGTLSEERTQLLEQIGVVWNKNEARWQEMYDLAKKYYEENGSLVLITDINLKNWIQVQRQAYKGKGTYTKLSKQQIEKLESIGIVWDVKEKWFSEMYGLAKKYYEEHGDLMLPDKYEMDGKKVSSWIKDKRKAYKKGTLTEEQIEQLEAIGMVWDVKEYKWNQMYQQVKQYYDENGNLILNPSQNKQLCSWLRIQRDLYIKEEGLSEEQKRLLDEIEISKEIKKTKAKPKKEHRVSKKAAWDKMYKQAQEYYEANRNLIIPRDDEYSQLYNWVKNQRTKYNVDPKKCKLSKERIELLENIGMVWNIIEYQWNTIYAQAKAYYEQYGSLSIPDEREAEYKQLRTWIQEQKLKYNMKDRPNLSKEQVEQLEEIGIVWNVNQASYDNMYKQAKKYFEEHGNLLIPRTEEYKTLSNWIKAQRRKYKSEDGLSQEEIERLEAIGMIWDIKQHGWDTMYAQAKAYYEEHGNLSFPYNDKRYKKLSTWIQNKKSGYYGKGSCRLTDEQVEQLKAIGVIQEDRTEQEESLEELEGKLQGLVEKKKASSQLVSDFERVKKLKSANKGVEK